MPSVEQLPGWQLDSGAQGNSIIIRPAVLHVCNLLFHHVLCILFVHLYWSHV